MEHNYGSNNWYCPDEACELWALQLRRVPGKSWKTYEVGRIMLEARPRKS